MLLSSTHRVVPQGNSQDYKFNVVLFDLFRYLV